MNDKFTEIWVRVNGKQSPLTTSAIFRFAKELEKETKKELHSVLEEKQAQIDKLMLEYCPEEMTVEQMDNWRKHQKPLEIG